MMNHRWKLTGALAVLMLASPLVGGQAHAETKHHHHHRSHPQHQTLGQSTEKTINQTGQGQSAALPTQDSANSTDFTSTNANGMGEKIIQAGEKYMGTPYQYGSSRFDKSTMDCSEFTMWAYREGAGIDLGRGGARSQYQKVTHISRNDLQVGDLVFFSTKATMKYSPDSINRIGHVGIYAGNNKILHTYGKGGVTYSDMASGWWDTHFVAAGRA